MTFEPGVRSDMGPAEGRPMTTTGWTALLVGAEADLALEAAHDIARAVAVEAEGGEDASLANGDAGAALLYAWLSRAHPGIAAAERRHTEHMAREFLDSAIAGLSAGLTDASLFTGIAGVAWAVDMVDALLDEDGGEDRNSDIDAYLLQLLRSRRRLVAPQDLIRSVTGIGVYALRRHPRADAVSCIPAVLQHLQTAAFEDADGRYWWTAPDEAPNPEVDRLLYPSGYVDLGVAHGVAGVIALLGAISQRPCHRADALPLLDGAVRWFLAQGLHTEDGLTFPACVAPGMASSPVGPAWCYGDPGVAVALLTAARGLGDQDLERTAVGLASRAAAMSATVAVPPDGGICHGAAGLAHMYNRLYQSTGEQCLRAAALYWVQHTLTDYHNARATAPTTGSGWVEGGEDGPWDTCDVIQGAAGVALVLLAAATSLEPAWDGMFLMSPDLLVSGLEA
jgi:lantibiotic biosynthesis protein